MTNDISTNLLPLCMLGGFPTHLFLLSAFTLCSFCLYLKCQHMYDKQINQSTNCIQRNKLGRKRLRLCPLSRCCQTDTGRLHALYMCTGYSVLSPAYWFPKSHANNYKTSSLVSIIRSESETWLPRLDFCWRNMISIPLTRIQLLTLMENYFK